ncbi:hypothetical protein L6R53_25160 [Myxococcota bacterium]|nr:hypothetical protein [Myxococcota bacterium]
MTLPPLDSIADRPEGVEALLADLAELGLSRNEALAYLTLLEDDGGEGLTGYEVAARSGIPRSAVYAVLRKLERAGAAFDYGTDPQRFVASPPDRWMGELRRTTLARMDDVQARLARLPRRDRPEPVWILTRYEQVISRISKMIRGAERSIYLSLWDRELNLLRPALEAVADRPLHRVLHSPARITWRPAQTSLWIDDVTDDVAKALWSHKAMVVIDRTEALIGGTEPAADNHAVWTTNPSLVDVATNHIILDITLMARARGIDPVGDVAPMMRPHLGPPGQDPA